DGLQRHAAQTRNRGANGLGRRDRTALETNTQGRISARVIGRGNWLGRRVCNDEIAKQLAVRGQAKRRANVCDGFTSVDFRRAAGLLYPGAPRHESRSAGSAAIRVTSTDFSR